MADKFECLHCKYLYKNKEGKECRRFPPKTGSNNISLFPVAYYHYWCGEFKIKED